MFYQEPSGSFLPIHVISFKTFCEVVLLLFVDSAAFLAGLIIVILVMLWLKLRR